jgi:peptidyl-prolyl cis-trans isomerase D
MASHILIVPNFNLTIEECWAKADSLLTLIKDGADFTDIAMAYSEDPGSSQRGGNLGWFTDGIMVSEFNEACFKGEKGDLTIVETQFGVHIVKINDQSIARRKISLATINKGIHFSHITANYYYSQASTFSTENSTEKKFDEAIIKNNYSIKKATKIQVLDNQINDIENSRDIVFWLFSEKTTKGDISTVFSYRDKYVVAKVSAVREKGVLPLDDVTEIINPIIIKDKKAEKLISDLNKDLTDSIDINAIATKYDLTSDTLKSISFSLFTLPRIGIEPHIIATATNTSKDAAPQVIKGNNGVIVIRIVNSTNAPEKNNYSDEQFIDMKNNALQVYKMFDAIQKEADIEDYRSRYF